jgi:signal transduction histidine kinase
VVDWFTADEPEQDAQSPGSARAPLSGRLVETVRAHPLVADAALAAVVLAISVVHSVIQGGHATTAEAWVLQVSLAAPIMWRRRYPVVVFSVVAVAAFVQWIYGERFLADMAILIALYSVTTRAPRRAAAAAAATVEVGVVLAAEQHILGVSWERAFVLLSGMVAAAYFLGTNIRTRKAYTAALVERAERLELERDQQAQIAIAAERASIAREMHDIVAHSLAVIVTMAEAAVAKRRSDPARADAAMAQVSETGRQALEETRRLLGVLRTDPTAGEFAPQPGLAQLDTLLDQVRATGLAAELVVIGERFDVPDSGQLAIYRIIQEVLTNTIKHATGATRVCVKLRYDRPVVAVDISDDGSPQLAARSGEGVGHGLVGMRERAALYNGTLSAGRDANRGWRVSARIGFDHQTPT